MEKRAERISVALFAGSFLLGLLEAWLQDRIGLAWYAAAIAVAVAIVPQVKRFALKSIFKSVSYFPHGLLVYSDSPLWANHIESRWLPVLGAKLVVWKLSSERPWRDYIRRLFIKTYTPDRSELQLPLVIIYAEKKAPTVLHFHDAFLDLQFGDEEALGNKERRLAREIGSSLWNYLDAASPEKASNPAAPTDQKALLSGR
jgi:hypothetical protein